MNKLYRQVPIEDKHAGTFGMYFTSGGDVTYGTVWLEQSTCLWQCDFLGHKTYVTHALEEVTIPNIDHLRYSSGNNDRYEEHRDIYDDGYEDGLNDGYIDGFKEAIYELKGTDSLGKEAVRDI